MLSVKRTAAGTPASIAACASYALAVKNNSTSNADKYLQRIGRAKFRQLLLEYSQTGIESV